MSLEKSALVRAVSTWSFCALLLAGLSSLAVAQSDAPALPPPPPPDAMMMHGPGPGGPVFHQEFGEGFENKVVTGVPMSGDLSVTRDTTLVDGNHIHNQTQTDRKSVV